MNLRHYYLGCKGWRNQPWVKEEGFYRSNLDPKDYLASMPRFLISLKLI
jgi:uncharacterized protein YecE (DUF72 family)